MGARGHRGARGGAGGRGPGEGEVAGARPHPDPRPARERRDRRHWQTCAHEAAVARTIHHALSRYVPRPIRRFWRIAWDANITGMSSMVAYNLLYGVIPVALLALFIAGHVLASDAIQNSVLRDLQEIFPGTAKGTLDTLLDHVRSSTTGTGILALVGSLWLGAMFWGSLDTAFSKIYGCPSRPWLKQKRFGLGMVFVVILFLIATVAVPTAQSILRNGVKHLPFDLEHVGIVVYAGSLAVGLALASRLPIPWGAAEANAAFDAFDGDPWPYGLEPNRTTLDAFLGYAHEQGVCAKRLAPEDLFEERVHASFRI